MLHGVRQRFDLYFSVNLRTFFYESLRNKNTKMKIKQKHNVASFSFDPVLSGVEIGKLSGAYIILLRGINVSGKNKLPMANLRELLKDLGFQNIQTYIQSGNIILNSDKDKVTVCKKIKEGIASKFGYDVPVLARTIDEWQKAIDNNPYPTENHKILCFTFLSEIPKENTFEVPITNDDNFTVIDDVAYIYCPEGFARTKLTNNLFEKKLKVTATSRNYRTTMKLLELAKSPS